MPKGLDPDYWGPTFWSCIHLICLSPLTSSNDILMFLRVVQVVLPCKFCRDSLNEYISLKHPSLYSNSKLDLFRWTVEVHNYVNSKKNKPTLNLEKAYKIWSSQPHFVITQSLFELDTVFLTYILLNINDPLIGKYIQHLNQLPLGTFFGEPRVYIQTKSPKVAYIDQNIYYARTTQLCRQSYAKFLNKIQYYSSNKLH